MKKTLFEGLLGAATIVIFAASEPAANAADVNIHSQNERDCTLIAKIEKESTLNAKGKVGVKVNKVCWWN